MTPPRAHPAGRIAIAVARERGWDVGNVGEAEVAQALEIMGYGPSSVETQYKVGRYRLDFAMPEKRLAIEADGWVHTAESVAERDRRRDAWLAEQGWTMIRINTEVGDILGQLKLRIPDRAPTDAQPGYPRSRVLPGAIARLSREDWHEMTRAANSSANHVSSDDRWTRQAAEANPALSEGQAYRLGQMLKKQHYRRMAKLSAQARAAKR